MDPFAVLGIDASANDEAIRQRYLELVRQFPPERNPEKFAVVRAAYDATRDLTTRVRYQLFEAGNRETIDSIIEDLACQKPRHRVSLETLIATVVSRR